jgi:hypothetical protein
MVLIYAFTYTYVLICIYNIRINSCIYRVYSFKLPHNTHMLPATYTYTHLDAHVFAYCIYLCIQILICIYTHHIHTQALPTGATDEAAAMASSLSLPMPVPVSVVHVPVRVVAEQPKKKKKNHDWSTPKASAYLKKIDSFACGFEENKSGQTGTNLSCAKGLDPEYFGQIKGEALRKALGRYRASVKAAAMRAPAPAPVASRTAGASAASSISSQDTRGQKRGNPSGGGGGAAKRIKKKATVKGSCGCSVTKGKCFHNVSRAGDQAPLNFN